jgi:PAS domain S-box-containing protein
MSNPPTRKNDARLDKAGAPRATPRKERHALAYALLIALWVALAAYMAWDRKAELAHVVPQTSALADAIAVNTERSLDLADHVAATIAQQVQRDGFGIALRDYVASGLARADGIKQISVLDKDGVVRASTDQAIGTIDQAGRDMLRMHAEPGSPSLLIGKAAVGGTADKPSLVLSRRIDDTRGNLAGVVLMSFVSPYLSGCYDTLRIGERGLAALVDTTDMTVRARRSGASIGVDVPLPGDSPLREALSKNREGALTARSAIDGVDRVLAYRRLHRYPLAVAVGFSTVDALRVYRARTLVLVIAGLALSALLALVELYRVRFARNLQASLERERDSDRRRIEKAGHIESLLRAIPDAVVSFSQDGRINGYNPRLLQLLGWDKPTTSNATPSDVVRALLARDLSSDRAEKERRLIALLQERPDARTVSMPIEAAIPEPVVYELRIECGVGTPAETVVLIRDITVHAKIRDNERALDATLRAIGDAVIAIDAEGRIKRLNPAAEELVGWSQPEAIGRHHREVLRMRNLTTGEDAPLPVSEVLKSGHLFSLAETRVLVTRNHGERKIAVSIAPARRESGDALGVVVVLRDVTRKYKSEQALIRSEQRHRQLIGMLPYGVILGQDKKIKFANPHALEMLGAHTAGEVLGRSAFDFVHPDSQPIVAERIARMEQSGEMAPRIEEKWRRLDGTTFIGEVTAVPYEVDGKPGALIMLADITDRKRVEAERDRFFDLSLDLIALADSKGYFRRVNPAFSRVLGWSCEELTTRPFIEFVHPADRAATIAEIRRSGGGSIDHFENRYLCRDGSIRWVAWKAVLVDGMIYATGRDVTDSRTATQQLEQARYDAESASRSKSAFLAAMSHEIRTPMNGVIGMTEALAQTDLADDQKDMLSTIGRSAHSLLVIIDDILDFSKIEAGKLDIEFTDVALVDLAESVCRSMITEAERRGVTLSLVVEPEVPEYVVADETRLRQILNNLISNAIKFSAGRPGIAGAVSVRIAMNRERPAEVVFSVADNGIGMSSETISKLFKPFTQGEASTTRRFGGTGLGLAISRRLIDMMSGTISVTSTEGAGSTFTVRLRFDLPAHASASDLPELHGVQCLLAGDGYDRDGIGAWLRRAGADVRIAQASALAEQGSDRSRVLLVVVEESDSHSTAPSPGEAPVARIWLKAGARGALQRVDPCTVRIGAVGLQRRALLEAASVALGRSHRVPSSEVPVSVARAPKARPLSVGEAREWGQLILVAEDDEVNQSVILKQLAILGHAAEIANNGREAMALWRKHRYALVFTDLHMPEMDGYELVTAIRAEERAARCPVIALTANAIQGEAARAIALGMDDYLTKPLQLNRLKAVLDRYLSEPEHSAAATATATPPQSTASAGGTLDLAVLRSVVGDDEDTGRELLEEYLACVQRLAVELRDHCMAGRGREASAVAHKLKSSSRSVGALGLGELCAHLEQVGKTADPARLEAWVHEFDGTIDAVRSEITRLLKSDLT